MMFRRMCMMSPLFRSNLCHSESKRFVSTKISFKIRPKSELIGPIGYLLLVVPGATFCLGTWQIQRRKWKLGLLEELREKTTAPPIDLPDNLKDTENLEYQRVKVKGKYLHDQEMYIRPRSLVTPQGGEKESSGLMSTAQSGAYVVTPFKLSNREETILVNRGWVPRKMISPKTRPNGQIQEEVEIIGLVRKSEPRVPLGPKQSVSDGNVFWMLRDVWKMAAAANVSPVFLDACAMQRNINTEDGPIPGQTRINLRNEHLSYIITWYALTIATSFLWYRRYKLGKSLM